MLDPKIDLCLRIIANNRPNSVRTGWGKCDEMYCRAFNHLLSSLQRDRPATRMLHFGNSSLTGKTKLSHAKRVEWVRRYAKRHGVCFRANRRNSRFLTWSQIVTFEQSQPEYFGPVGDRIAQVLKRRRYAA